MSAGERAVVDKAVSALADGDPVPASILGDSALGQETLDALKVVDDVRRFWGQHFDDSQDSRSVSHEVLLESHQTAVRGSLTQSSNQRLIPASDASLGEVFGRSSIEVDTNGTPDLTNSEPWGPLMLLEYLGGGSFGEVYRAWEPELRRVVALKRTRYSSPADAERARRELQHVAGLPANRQVITVHGTCTVDDQVGIWMEFLPGVTVRRLLRVQGRMSWEEAALHGVSLCRALQHVHNSKLLHRDLKTENVMKAADDGRLVLIDFGSSQQAAPSADAQGPTRLVGTLAFMAPELFEGRPATPQTDIYSVGVILFNLVTGRYPVEGGSVEEFEQAHRAGRRVSLWDVRTDLPKPFVDVVERATSPAPGKRFQTAGELLSELAALRSDDVVVEPPVTWETRAKQGVWLTLSALVLAAGMGIVSSRFFNSAVGRAEFTNEGLWDYVTWGAQGLVVPVVLSLATVLGLVLCTGCRRLLVDRSLAYRRLDGRLCRWAHRLRLDDVETLSSLSLLGSILALVGTYWYFAYRNPIISKFITATYPSISTSPRNALAFLAPQFDFDRQLYKAGLTAVVVATLALWYPTLRLVARRRVSLNRAVVLGGASVLAMALLLDFPYRLVAPHGRRFQKVNWNGASCYLLGERQVDLLLFCPRSTTPRNKTVRRSDPRVDILNEEGDLFEDVE